MKTYNLYKKVSFGLMHITCIMAESKENAVNKLNSQRVASDKLTNKYVII